MRVSHLVFTSYYISAKTTSLRSYLRHCGRSHFIKRIRPFVSIKLLPKSFSDFWSGKIKMLFSWMKCKPPPHFHTFIKRPQSHYMQPHLRSGLTYATFPWMQSIYLNCWKFFSIRDWPILIYLFIYLYQYGFMDIYLTYWILTQYSYLFCCSRFPALAIGSSFNWLHVSLMHPSQRVHFLYVLTSKTKKLLACPV